MDIVNSALRDISQQTGFQLDQLKYVFCLLLAYPLAFIHRSLPDSPAFKHAFSGSMGFLMGYFCFGNDIIHSVITSIFTYIVVSTVKGKLAPTLVFIGTLAHLSLSHLYRQFGNWGGYELDYTGPQMVLIIKLTSFAFNVYDGQRTEKISDELRSRSLSKIPSPLEFFGYVYFFGGFLAGPAMEIREYLEFTNMQLFPKNKTGQHEIPSNFLPTLKTFFFSLLCFGVLTQKSKFGVFYTTTEEFLSQGFLYKFLYVQLSVSLQRFQYYFIWLIAEGACILTGLGYSGTVNGKHKWDRCSNVDIIALETSQNFKSITDSWNKKTNNWLKYYIYLRLTPESGKPTNLATFATYLTSAFWHGFYPGYYITFFTGAIMTVVARSLRQKVRPYFMKDDKTPLPTKPFYDLLSWIATFSSLNYICASFVLLQLEYAWNLYISLYFFVHVGAALAFIGLKFIPSKKLASTKPKSS